MIKWVDSFQFQMKNLIWQSDGVIETWQNQIRENTPQKTPQTYLNLTERLISGQRKSTSLPIFFCKQ